MVQRTNRESCFVLRARCARRGGAGVVRVMAWTEDDVDDWLGGERVENERAFSCPTKAASVLLEACKNGGWDEDDVVPEGTSFAPGDEKVWRAILSDALTAQSETMTAIRVGRRSLLALVEDHWEWGRGRVLVQSQVQAK